jgi:hypothetical protein
MISRKIEGTIAVPAVRSVLRANWPPTCLVRERLQFEKPTLLFVPIVHRDDTLGRVYTEKRVYENNRSAP